MATSKEPKSSDKTTEKSIRKAPVSPVTLQTLPAEPPKRLPSPFLVPGAILIAGLMIAVSVYFSMQQFGGGAANQLANAGGAQPNQQPAQLTAPHADTTLQNVDSGVDKNGVAYIGRANAPVTIKYWFDYQCPFCERFETQTLPTIVSKYVETGKLKFEFHMFPFLGEDSSTAALAGRAVIDTAPKKFFLWQQTMFANQGPENSGWATKDRVIAITKFVPGIDADKVGKLMDQKRADYRKLIDADKNEGQKDGINGTPGFYIGGQTIAGAQPTSVFTKIIDSELAKAGK